MRLALNLALLGVVGAAATGCANMTSVAAGTSYAEVQKQFGSPTITCPLAESGVRAVWSQQPFGQYAWATDVSPTGAVGPVVQVLDDNIFNELLVAGVSTADTVQCAFGPPANIGSVGLPSVRQTMWSYRYRQYGVWNMLMNVFFDPETGLVVSHSPSLDPMYDDSLRWPFLL